MSSIRALVDISTTSTSYIHVPIPAYAGIRPIIIFTTTIQTTVIDDSFLTALIYVDTSLILFFISFNTLASKSLIRKRALFKFVTLTLGFVLTCESVSNSLVFTNTLIRTRRIQAIRQVAMKMIKNLISQY